MQNLNQIRSMCNLKDGIGKTHFLKTFQQSTADNVNLPELCFLIKS